MHSLRQDLRFGARSLAKSPGLALVAVIALSLGIGLTTLMFSIIYGGLMKGLPFADSHELVHLERNNPSRDIESMEVSIHDLEDWRARQRSFDGLAGFYTGTVNVAGTERPERFDGAFISANAFSLIGASALMGRTFRDGEDRPGAEPVIILGYTAWKNRFGGDPDIVNSAIRVNGRPTTIIGVMPEGFAFPLLQEVWVPLQLDAAALPRGEGMSLEVFGRLRDGVTMDAAQVELSAIAKAIADEHPRTNEGVGANIQPFTHEYIGEEPRGMLYTMLGAVFFVLLIACANVANLLLSRAAARTREVGIRTALGASRRRVIMQFIAEAVVLAGVGALLGIGLAYVGIGWFNRALAVTDTPFWIDVALHPPVLFFAIGVTMLAAIISGILPAVQASRLDVSEILKDESRGSSGMRIGKLTRSLVVAEIALSCGLLVGAGLMIKSVTKLRTVDFGFDGNRVFTARVGLPEPEYPDTLKQIRFWEQLEERVAAIPGVEAVSITQSLPALGTQTLNFMIEGATYTEDRDYPYALQVIASPGYFETFEIPVRRGRVLLPQDRQGTMQVAVVNESFVAKHFANQDPIGRRIRFGTSQSTAPWTTIVGVVPDRHAQFIDDDETEAIYVPIQQHWARFMYVAATARSNAPALAMPIRDAVVSLDPDLPIYWPRTHTQAVAEETWFYRVFGTLFMVFGAVALFLAAIGLYAVMAFSVGQRTREVGVRMALGAQRSDVIGLVLRQGVVQMAIGMTVGLAFAAGVSQLLQVILFKVEPRDPVIFAGVFLVLGGAAALACLLPARRATKIDPIIALRSD